MRGWLDDGVDEVCVAVADEQTEGRGRLDRAWQDQPGARCWSRPASDPGPARRRTAWRLPAIASIAMLGAATSLLGPTADRLALKWPNDIIAVHRGRLLKVAGVLTEGSLEGEHLATVDRGPGRQRGLAGGRLPGRAG